MHRDDAFAELGSNHSLITAAEPPAISMILTAPIRSTTSETRWSVPGPNTIHPGGSSISNGSIGSVTVDTG